MAALLANSAADSRPRKILDTINTLGDWESDVIKEPTVKMVKPRVYTLTLPNMSLIRPMWRSAMADPMV